MLYRYHGWEACQERKKEKKEGLHTLIYMVFIWRTRVADPAWTIKGTGIPFPRFRCPLEVQNQVLRQGLKLNLDNIRKIKGV